MEKHISTPRDMKIKNLEETLKGTEPPQKPWFWPSSLQNYERMCLWALLVLFLFFGGWLFRNSVNSFLLLGYGAQELLVGWVGFLSTTPGVWLLRTTLAQWTAAMHRAGV